ncbi:hypothetical protein ON010_g15616 [Phytophthora cinnamomi]|nr:hypothetical protein ON010_g15616 [Phytophthora cinnamomi]
MLQALHQAAVVDVKQLGGHSIPVAIQLRDVLLVGGTRHTHAAILAVLPHSAIRGEELLGRSRERTKSDAVLVATPGVLDNVDDHGNTLFAQDLQSRQRLWVTQENFVTTKTEASKCVRVLFERNQLVFVVRVSHTNSSRRKQVHRSLAARVGDRVRPGGLRQEAVALDERAVRLAVAETLATHAQVFHQTKVSNLLSNKFLVHGQRLLVLVGLNTTDVVRVATIQLLEQVGNLRTELLRGRRRALELLLLGALVKENLAHEGIRRVFHAVLQVVEESVHIGIEEQRDIVLDLAGVVNNAEVGATHTGCNIVRVPRVLAVVALNQLQVRQTRDSALLVQQRENTVLLGVLDQVAHDLVVEELDVLPAQTFTTVALLLALERLADEELLQLLVHVVDAELLEGVDLEDLEAVDVQDADAVVDVALLARDVRVDARDDPVEDLLVERAHDRVADLLGLAGVEQHLLVLLVDVDDAEGEQGLELVLVDAHEARGLGQRVAGLGGLDRGARVVRLVRGLLELHVAEPEDGGELLEDVSLLGVRDAHGRHVLAHVRVVLGVVHAVDRGVLVAQHVELLGALGQLPGLALRGRGAREQLVEGVEVALALGLADHAAALEQVVVDVAADDLAHAVHLQHDVLAEAAAVVVADGLRVAQRAAW